MNSINVTHAVNSISADGELLLYGEIGNWWDDLDAESVVDQLERLSGDEIVVRIHSGGGLIMDGLAIYNRLKQSPKTVTVYIDGIAASMASAVAMAGDRIIMPDNALMMIHKPWVIASGDSDELRRNADVLDTMEASLLSIYRAKTGLETDALSAMLTDETWMNGTEAYDLGFVDEVVESIRAAASVDLSRVNPPKTKIDLLIHNTALSEPTQESPDMNSTGTPETKISPTDQPSAPSPENCSDNVQRMVDTAAQDAVAAERTRVKELQTIGAQAAVTADVIGCWIADGVSPDEARQTALNMVAERDNSNAPVGGHINIVSRDTTVLRSAVASAMLNRHSPSAYPLDDQSGQFRGMSFLETARAYIDMTGGVTQGKSKNEIIAMAMHTASDFPLILGDVASRTLQTAYSEGARNFTTFTRQSNAMDFRTKHSLQIGAGEGLEEVKEDGEYKRGTVSEGRESYKLATFGRIFNFTRQLMINDDVGAMLQFIENLGRLSLRKELDVVYALITGNPVLADGTAAFHNTHRNLVSSGTGVTEIGLSAGRELMRKQKGLDKEPINVRPSVVLVSSERETEAEKALATVIANQTSGVNPFAGTQELVVESRLDDFANNPWYQFASPSELPAIEWSYLEGEEGPRIETRHGFETDGLDIKIGHDFGAGWVNHRGAVKNPGA